MAKYKKVMIRKERIKFYIEPLQAIFLCLVFGFAFLIVSINKRLCLGFCICLLVSSLYWGFLNYLRDKKNGKR